MGKSLLKYVFLLVIAIGLSVGVFANQNLNSSYDYPQTVDNYYVQPGAIFIAPNGIYAFVDGNMIQIHMLLADARGVFIPYEEIIAANLAYCPFCQGWYKPGEPHGCQGPRS